MNRYFFWLLSLVGITTHTRFRLALRGVMLVTGLVAAFFVSMLMETGEFVSSAIVFTLVIATAVIEFVFSDVLADRSFPFETERKLALMEKRLGADAIKTISARLERAINCARACDKERISATVHVMTELTTDRQSRYGLLQLTDYVGPDGGKKGRITFINQGVIGRCARTQQVEWVDFANADEYRDRMVREFGFTKAQANAHTQTGRSYLAYPLMNESAFVGVLYFFTTEPQVFPVASREMDLEEVSREVLNYLKISQLV